MTTQKLSNITLKQFRVFLKNSGCSFDRYNSGHETWNKKGLLRPITFQTHVEPVPEFIIKNALDNLSLTKKDFFTTLNKKK